LAAAAECGAARGKLDDDFSRQNFTPKYVTIELRLSKGHFKPQDTC
jgi:hypothetical protein